MNRAAVQLGYGCVVLSNVDSGWGKPLEGSVNQESGCLRKRCGLDSLLRSHMFCLHYGTVKCLITCIQTQTSVPNSEFVAWLDPSGPRGPRFNLRISMPLSSASLQGLEEPPSIPTGAAFRRRQCRWCLRWNDSTNPSEHLRAVKPCLGWRRANGLEYAHFPFVLQAYDDYIEVDKDELSDSFKASDGTPQGKPRYVDLKMFWSGAELRNG